MHYKNRQQNENIRRWGSAQGAKMRVECSNMELAEVPKCSKRVDYGSFWSQKSWKMGRGQMMQRGKCL